jgi:hypothetical protein
MRRLDSPAVLILLRDGAASPITTTFPPDVRDIATHLQPRPRLLLVVALVGVKVLATAKWSAWPCYRNRIDGFKRELAVVDVGTG